MHLHIKRSGCMTPLTLINQTLISTQQHIITRSTCVVLMWLVKPMIQGSQLHNNKMVAMQEFSKKQKTRQ